MEIHPNAFATELNKMIPAKIGHRYCIINRKTFLLLNVPPPYVTSSSILFTPTTLETKRQVAIAAIGIMTEFVRKSKKSKNCMPMIFTFARGPYPSEDRLPSAIMITPQSTVDFFRLHPSSSSNVDTALSVSAIELVSAAKSTSKKNITPAKVPNPILAKTFGIVININAGPACKVSGSPPENANTAGIIISPAIIAIAVSKISTFFVDSSMEVSFSYKNQM